MKDEGLADGGAVPAPSYEPEAGHDGDEDADHRLLRRGLALVAGTAPSPGQSGVVLPRRRPHPRLIAAAAALLVVGMIGGGWVWATSAREGQSVTGSTVEGSVACSREIVIGRVSAQAPVGDGRLRVSIDVERHIKPESGSPTISVMVEDPATVTGAPAWPIEERVLVQVFDSGDPVRAVFGSEVDRAAGELAAALPASEKLRCAPAG